MVVGLHLQNYDTPASLRRRTDAFRRIMLITTIDQMHRWSAQQRRDGKQIGVVPTMGYLHNGHCSLIKCASNECDVVVTTIFVNPLQFGVGEDFERYPRDLQRDYTIASDAGTTVVFAPRTDEMYPSNYATFVDVGPIGEKFEGTFRPGHFRGVVTVVAKLFHITQPHLAYFGQKDYQQTLVIAQLIRDLNFDISMVVLPTVREHDGLAMSSRNVYLSPEQRHHATALYRALQAATNAINSGERRSHALAELMTKVIADNDHVRVDYAAAVQAGTLEEVTEFSSGEQAALLVAGRIGPIRLIDNELVTIP
ncbi:MAG: pantoate--beta-alanine ligase [Chlorobi bacterium]|nr:pantoate--beta-alanine ligase [Chlorobiota bacterium]